MGINAVQAVAVVDHHRAAGEIHVRDGERDHAVRHRPDRRAHRRRDVDPSMGLAWLAVQNALTAVDPAEPPRDRPDERLSDSGRRGGARLGRLDQPGVGPDPDQIRLARRDLAGRQAVDPLDRVVARRDLEPPGRLGRRRESAPSAPRCLPRRGRSRAGNGPPGRPAARGRRSAPRCRGRSGRGPGRPGRSCPRAATAARRRRAGPRAARSGW